MCYVTRSTDASFISSRVASTRVSHFEAVRPSNGRYFSVYPATFILLRFPSHARRAFHLCGKIFIFIKKKKTLVFDKLEFEFDIFCIFFSFFFLFRPPPSLNNPSSSRQIRAGRICIVAKRGENRTRIHQLYNRLDIGFLASRHLHQPAFLINATR